MLGHSLRITTVKVVINILLYTHNFSEEVKNYWQLWHLTPYISTNSSLLNFPDHLHISHTTDQQPITPFIPREGIPLHLEQDAPTAPPPTYTACLFLTLLALQYNEV